MPALVVNAPILMARAEAATDHSRSPKVVVTAKRVPSELTRTAENIQVYTEGDLKRWPARDLGEVLKYIPGVDLKVSNQFGQSTSLSIYGSESRHVLLMVDGIPFNTQLSGQANPTRLPINNIKQIEVIKGASSSAWGSALGGVINVITKDPGKGGEFHGNLTSAHAEYVTLHNSLELAGGVENTGYYVMGSFFNTHGIRDGADTEISKVFGKVSHAVNSDTTLTGSFGYTAADANDIVPDPSLGRMDIHQPNFARYGQVQLNTDQGLLNVNAALKYNKQNVKTNTVFLDFGGIRTSVSGTDVYYGFSLNGSYPFREEDLLVIGGDFERQTFKVSPNVRTAESVNKQAPYANYTFVTGNWDIIPGIRYDNNEVFGAQLSPSLGTVYHFQDQNETRLRFKSSKVFNAPPLLWIHQHTSTTLPNPELEPEKGFVYELGMDTHPYQKWDVDFNLYWAEIEDAIATVTVNGKSRKDNFNKFRRRGAELLLSYELNEDWDFYTTAGFNDVRNTETEEIVKDQGIARQSFGWGARYHNEQGFGADLSGYYNRWSSLATLRPNDRKPIFDLKMTQKLPELTADVDVEAFVNVYNIANSKYWSSISLPQPQRYFEGGLSVDF